MSAEFHEKGELTSDQAIMIQEKDENNKEAILRWIYCDTDNMYYQELSSVKTSLNSVIERPVNSEGAIVPISKRPQEADASKRVMVEEHISQEDLLNSVNETSNTFKKIEFSTFGRQSIRSVHNLLEDCELESLFERLSLEDKNQRMSKTARKYMMLFDQIIEESLDEEKRMRRMLKKSGRFEWNSQKTSIPHHSHFTDSQPTDDPDPDKFKAELPTWNVCKTLGIFPTQAFGSYLFSPFTIPNPIILTSATNLEHVSRLIRSLLCLRDNVVKIEKFKKFERSGQRRIMKPTTKYATGVSPGRLRTVTFAEFYLKRHLVRLIVIDKGM
ncbi:2177_t:CDS:2 [Acaulospora morrowiae]|uniref:2177_t:CDS:1 n=1 Tax=Acaulospora morrowiae TaxID=94023 RepID=A0A9N8ZYS4_9GLOM|nr:2177_t:CDS:2 [Acaulospora morrowiae]